MLALTIVAVTACGGTGADRPTVTSRPDPTGSVAAPSVPPPSTGSPAPSEDPSAGPFPGVPERDGPTWGASGG